MTPPPLELARAAAASYEVREDFGPVKLALSKVGPGDWIAAIPGTETDYDWLSNLERRLVWSERFRVAVHDGFACTFEAIRASLDARLLTIRRSLQRLHLVGHSRGAVIACLWAWHLRQHLNRWPIAVTLTGLGSPRWTNFEGVAAFPRLDGRQYRFRYDPVPAIPVWRPDRAHRYESAGEWTWLGMPGPKGCQAVERAADAALGMQSASALTGEPGRAATAGMSWHDLPGIGDHDVDAYVRAIEAAGS